jgi:MoxR-like ATPase
MHASTATPIPPPDAPPVDLASVRKRLIANQRILCGPAGFYERADILHGLNVAATAREHVLKVGPPGTAKSDLARSWASQFTGTYREDLFTRQSTEADHLAYLDVQAFTNGQYVYRTDGKITEAHIAFGDETFKSTGGFLNALLGWLNERNVRGGYKSPLITFIGASNEFGEDESVAALEDRLMIRFYVEPIAKRAARLAFLSSCAAPRPPLALAPITIDELNAAHAASRALPCDPLVFEALADVQASLNGAGIYVSDRRLAKCVRILQAVAWLDGAAMVEVDHLDFLRNVLWRRPDDRPAVETALGAINKGMIGEIRVIVEKLLDAYTAGKAQPGFGQQALGMAEQLKTGAEEIRARFGGQIPDRVKERARGYLAELKGAYEECLGIAKASGLHV